MPFYFNECGPEDPALLLAEFALEICSQLKSINHTLGVFMADSIQTNTQSPAEKKQRHTDNLRTIQENLTLQLKDLNAGLQRIQDSGPPVLMNDLFTTEHQLDSNFRALLDLAKEAAEISSEDVPTPPKLIPVIASSDVPEGLTSQQVMGEPTPSNTPTP